MDDMTTFRLGCVKLGRGIVDVAAQCLPRPTLPCMRGRRSDGTLGVRCVTCLHTEGAMRGWFSGSKIGPVKALALVWSIVNGIPLRFARHGACPGTSSNVWARWVQSVGGSAV